MRRILVLIAASALLAAACGDDVGSVLDGGTAGTPATTAAPGGTDSPPTETTTEAPPTGTGSDDGLGTILAAYEDEPLKLEYLFGDGDDAETITIVQDPTRMPPVYATLIGPNGEEGRFLTIGDTSLVCGPPGEECLQFPDEMGMNMGQAMLGPLLTSVLALGDVQDNPGFSVEEGSTTIAGRDGVCFTFRPTMLATGVDVEFVRQCVDREFGFILLFEGLEEGGDAVERIMELQAWDRPSPGDFEPTGPVTTMPGGG